MWAKYISRPQGLCKGVSRTRCASNSERGGDMQNLNEHKITDEVVRRFASAPNPRLQEIMTSLVKHMHAFAREVQLTEDEWFQGIQFVTSVGQKCDDKRQEIGRAHV